MRLSQFSSVSFRIKSMDNRNNASPEKSLGLIYAYASIYLLPAMLYSVGCVHFVLATLFQNSWMYTGTCANIAYFNCHIYQTNLLECDIISFLCHSYDIKCMIKYLSIISLLNYITQLDALLIDLNLFKRKEIHVHKTMLLTGKY